MSRTLIRADRPGAALVMALLMLVVLDCIVIGTLHLSLQEHRIGVSRTMLLRLRLDAESGARRALAWWSAEIDSMRTGGEHRLDVPQARTGAADVQIERLGDHLFLVRSVAVEPEPRAGRSAAHLLVLPPALPPGTDAAPAPLSAAGTVHILATAAIRAAAPAGCAPAPFADAAVLLADPLALVVEIGAQLDAPSGSIGPRSITSAFDRVASLAAAASSATIVGGDTTIAAIADSNRSLVMIVEGNLIIKAPVAFRGLILARGSVTLEPGATVHGAVHTRAGATIAGEIQWDPCEVTRAVDATRLTRPTPAPPRPWLPAF